MKKVVGFTLIELLVVIAIIGLLISAVLSSFEGSRGAARDAVRASDFNQLRTALEIYYAQYQAYPCGDSAGSEYQDGQRFTIDTSLSNDGFLSGDEPGGTTDCKTNGNLNRDGLDDVGAYPLEALLDPLQDADNPGDTDYYYTYQVKFNRDGYILYVPMEQSNLAAEDGGLCDNWYEIGTGVGEIPIIEDPQYYDIPVPCN